MLNVKYIIAAKMAVQKVAEDDCEIGFTTKKGTVPRDSLFFVLLKDYTLAGLRSTI